MPFAHDRILPGARFRESILACPPSCVHSFPVLAGDSPPSTAACGVDDRLTPSPDLDIESTGSAQMSPAAAFPRPRRCGAGGEGRAAPTLFPSLRQVIAG